MLGEFIGVPRPALEAVFGRSLGRRIWEHNRGGMLRKEEPAPGTADSLATASHSEIRAQEILQGLIRHLSQRAAETLRQNRRKAQRLTLELTYTDGMASVERMHLGVPTDDSLELIAAGEQLILKMALDRTVQSISLHVSSVAAESLRQVPQHIESTPVTAAHALACAS